MFKESPQPPNSFRITLTLSAPGPRLDQLLIEELRKQDRCFELKHLSRAKIKKLFAEKRIRIKGQNAVPSSAIAQGTTQIDILGFSGK